MNFVSFPHSIYKISGPDSTRYLQGRLTQNIKTIQGNSAVWSFILSPQGKIEGVFYVVKDSDSYFLVSDNADPESRSEFVSSLFRFKVADQVFSEDISDEYRIVSIFSTAETDPELVLRLESDSYHFALARRGALFCLDLFIPKNDNLDHISNEYGLKEVPFEEFNHVRIEAGFPFSKQDIPASVFAPDLPVSRYVSFNKGCYAGQEVVEMATARGRPNKTFVSISGLNFSKSEDHLQLFIKNDEGIKKAGFITSYSPADVVFRKSAAIGYVKTALLDEGSNQFYAGTSEADMAPVTLSAIQ